MFAHSSMSDFESSDNESFNDYAYQWWRQHHGFSSKSVHGDSYNLYHDFISRFIHNEDAGIIFQGSAGVEKYTPYQIDLMVETLCCAWINQSVISGKVILIVMDTTLRRYVSILAALRLGLVISLLDSKAPFVIQEAISILNPDFISIESKLVDSAFAERVLKISGNFELTTIPIESYSLGSPLFYLFYSFSPRESSIKVISVERFFSGVIRDAHFILDLKPGYTLCTGDIEKSLASPLLEMACLFAGAKLHLIELDWLVNHPYCVFESQAQVVSISARLRDLLLKNSKAVVSPSRIQRWFRSANEALNFTDWQALINQYELENVPHADIFFNAALGGIIACSDWKTNIFDLMLSPVVGQAWYKGDIANPTIETMQEFGRYCLKVDERLDITPIVISQHQSKIKYLGFYPPGRQGLTYPTQLVLDAIKIETAWHVCVEVPLGVGENRVQYILLAFCDDRSSDELRVIIEKKIGGEAMPDKIVNMDYIPRLISTGTPNIAWCQQMFIGGEFQRRLNHPFYQLINKLRKEIFAKS
jgi:hypothetical protein